MRTTILLDDELIRSFRDAAREKGISLSAFLAEAGRSALKEQAPRAQPFELVTYGKEGVRDNVDLDKTSGLLAAEVIGQYGQ